MFSFKSVKLLLKLIKKEKNNSKQYIEFSDQKFGFCKSFAAVEITVKER